VENTHKKNIQSDPNLQNVIRQQFEEELNYYKNQTKELQNVIKFFYTNNKRNYKEFQLKIMLKMMFVIIIIILMNLTTKLITLEISILIHSIKIILKII